MSPNQSDFLKLLLQEQSRLRAFIGSLVSDRSELDDILQAIALILWEKFDEFDATRSFGAWARGIAANKIMQYREGQRRRPTPFSPEAIQAILDAHERYESRYTPPSLSALERCLERLSAPQRTLLDLFYGQSLSSPAIAQQVGLSTTATQKALSRTRKQLQECIERRLAATGETL